MKIQICNKKLYAIDSESKGNYSKDDLIKFLTKSLESSLCDYSYAYLLTGNITVKKRNNANTDDEELGAVTVKLNLILMIMYH